MGVCVGASPMRFVLVLFCREVMINLKERHFV